MLISRTAEDGTPVCELTPGSERRVCLRCDGDGCETISTVSWSNYQQSLRLHPERQGKTYCRPCGKIVGGVKRTGTTAPAVATANRLRVRNKHASWKGGRYVDSGGYVMIHCQSSSRTCGWAKYKKEHVLVMEHALGRRLRRSEVIHHINNDRQDNNLANLYLTTSRGHRLAHVSLTLSYQLLRAAGKVTARPTLSNMWNAYRRKLIRFDVTQGIYVAHLKSRELLESPHDL